MTVLEHVVRVLRTHVGVLGLIARAAVVIVSVVLLGAAVPPWVVGV